MLSASVSPRQQSKSWYTMVNAMFRDELGVEVDVERGTFVWRAEGPAFREDLGPVVRCITCREDTPTGAMVGAECNVCAGERVAVVGQ